MYSKIKYGRKFAQPAETAQHSLLSIARERLPFQQNTKLRKRKEVRVGAFSLRMFQNIAFVFQEIPWLQKFKTWEKWENRLHAALFQNWIQFSSKEI